MNTENALYYLSIALIFAPAILGAVSWRLLFTRKNQLDVGVVLMPLSVVTISYLVLILGIYITQDIIGQDYSTRRYITIYSNLLIVVVSLAWFGFHKTSLQCIVSVFSLLVAMGWLYLGIVSAVV